MDGDYKYNWDEMIKRLFHINEHRINNTNDEMEVKRRGGTKSKIVVERMLNVFDLHFPTPATKAMSRICACKTGRNLQIFGWACNSNSHARGLNYLTFVCKNKAGKTTQRGESSQKMLQKSSVLSFAWNAKKSLCKLNSPHCRQGKKWGRGGEVKGQWGGWAGSSFTPIYI